MLRFKQFLIEGIVNWYHKTDPGTAARLVSKEKIRSQGLSVFIDPAKAAEYTDITSAGHIPANAQTITGTVSTRRLVPDIEWNPESYKDIFKDVATKIEADPNYRVPSLTRVGISPSKGPMQFVTPGIVAETDPTTGKKKIGRGWEPGFALKDETTGALGEPKKVTEFPIEVDGKKIDIDDPRIKPVIQSRSQVTPYGTVGPETIEWGGRSTVGGRFPETRDLDVLARDSDLTKVTNKAINQNVKAFRTKSGSGVNVSGIVDPTQAIESTGKAVGKDVAGKVTNVVGKASAAFDPVGEVASQVLPRAASAAGLGAEVAMGAAMIPLAVGAFTQQAGDPMGDFKASFAPGEFEKWQERQEESRKKQNTSAIQSVIDRPYDPNQASPRRRQNDR